MKRLIKTTMLVAVGAVLATEAAQAASTDLILGFTGNGASSDAVVDLGSAASVGVGGSSVVDLIDSRGSSFSSIGLSGASFQGLLNTVFGSTVPNGANMTLAGGANGTSTFFYLSADRGMAGTATPNSTTPFAWSKNQQASVGGYPSAILNGASITGAGGNAAVPLSPGGTLNVNSFSYLILGVNNAGNSVQGDQGNLPNTAVSGGTAYEDVWFNNKGAGWTYDGYLSLDLTGDTTELLTFTPVAVPEPSTYGLLAGLGLLVVAIRRQFVAKSA